MAAQKSDPATSSTSGRTQPADGGRRQATRDLKVAARGGKAPVDVLLADPRASEMKVLRLLPLAPGCTLRIALEALLACQINGARNCGELQESECVGIAQAVEEVQRGAGPTRDPLRDSPEARDRVLDQVLERIAQAVPEVELLPSEFAAARIGLEADPLLLRMVDRLVAALRLYEERDDGGLAARVVLGQWIGFRNYHSKVASGEYPPPTQRRPVEVE